MSMAPDSWTVISRSEAPKLPITNVASSGSSQAGLIEQLTTISNDDFSQIHRRSLHGHDRFRDIWLMENSADAYNSLNRAYNVSPRIALTSDDQRSCLQTWEYADNIRKKANKV
jgi:hypothetical protein